MNPDLLASLAGALQQLELPPERAARAAATAAALNERIGRASLAVLALDDHPADFLTLLMRSGTT